jgi:hypothetical protein
MVKKLKRRSHHGPRETGPRPRAALPRGATVFTSYAELRDHGVSWTRVHLNRLVAEGLFPAPHRLSTHRIAWTLDALESWKLSRPLARVAGVRGAAPQAKEQQPALPQAGREQAPIRRRALPDASAVTRVRRRVAREVGHD